MPIEVNIIIEFNETKDYPPVVVVPKGVLVRFIARLGKKYMRRITQRPVRMTLYFEDKTPPGFVVETTVTKYFDGRPDEQETDFPEQKSNRNPNAPLPDADIVLSEGIVEDEGVYKYGIRGRLPNENQDFDIDPFLVVQ